MSGTSKRSTIYFDPQLHAALRLKAAHTNRIDALREEPRPVDCEKLSGLERYRIRQGRYRVVYEITDECLIVTVVKVAHRRHVYRR